MRLVEVVGQQDAALQRDGGRVERILRHRREDGVVRAREEEREAVLDAGAGAVGEEDRVGVAEREDGKKAPQLSEVI